MLYLLDLAGVIVFAISGAIVARDKQFDLFGGIVLACVTAIGGGTFRDLVLGRTPIFWLNDPTYILLSATTALVCFALFRNFVFSDRWRHGLAIADALGLALFTAMGVNIALALNISPVMAVIMGTMTGCFGGVIRDVLANQEPLIFQKEIYATASLIGGSAFVFVLPHTSASLAIGISALITSTLRILAIYRSWALPTYSSKE